MSIRPRPLGQAPAEYDQQWMNSILDRLDLSFELLARIIQSGYTTSNVTTTRTIDADATSTAEIADVLCTLIEDMKSRGVLG